jgi:glycosyltransferase involved in cell wall biosynthesis
MMRVLHVYKTYYPYSTGGCEQVIRTLTKYTTRLGCQNTLITLGPDSTSTRSDSLDVHYLPTTFEVSSCPVSFKADIIHFHCPWPFADLLYLVSMVKKPTIVTYQSDVVRQRFLKHFYHPIMKAFLSRVDKIVLTTDNYLNSSRDIQPYRDKCEVVSLGICQQDYPASTQDLLDSWQKRVGHDFILFVGVMRAYKGLDFLIDAVKDTAIPLVLIGSGSEEKRLKLKCKGMKNITFVGWVSDQDKIALIQLSKAVVLPSHLRSEAYGICLLEGLIFGKPLISTELNTVTGLVVPPCDSQALRQAMMTLYEDTALATQMGLKAREHFETNFKAQQMAQQYFKLYQDLLEAR